MYDLVLFVLGVALAQVACGLAALAVLYLRRGGAAAPPEAPPAPSFLKGSTYMDRPPRPRPQRGHSSSC